MSTTYNDAEQGYAVFARGDRKQDYRSSSNASSTTTFQATGSLKQGTQTISIPKSSEAKYVLIGNPFMSILDMEKVMADPANAGVIGPNIYVWDANIDGNAFKQGGYREVIRQSVNSWTSTGAGTNPNYIESGVAFFVMPASNVTKQLYIKESHKVDGVPGISPFGSVNDSLGRLFVNLEVPDTSGMTRLVDGVVAFFDRAYLDALGDMVDVQKQSNMGTGAFGFMHRGLRLSMEGRSWPKDDSLKSLSLDMRSVGLGNYTIRLIPSSMQREGFSMWLKDNVLRKEIRIDSIKETRYQFRIGNEAERDTARFTIEYRSVAINRQMVPEDAAPDSTVMIGIYPNPTSGRDASLTFGNIPAGNYMVEIFSMTGRLESTSQVEISGNRKVHVLKGTKAYPAGEYVVRVTRWGQPLRTLKWIVQ